MSSNISGHLNRVSRFVLCEMNNNKPVLLYLSHTVNKFSGCANFPSILKCGVGSWGREGSPADTSFKTQVSLTYRWAGPSGNRGANIVLRARVVQEL